MNKNQANGIAKDIAGKVQEKVGDIVGSTSQQAKGIQKQISGQAEEKLGDAKETLKDARDSVKHAGK